MQKINKYLKENHPIVYKNFINAIKNNKLSHVYLIKGENNNPLKEIAIFLAKSLVCHKNNLLACEECLICKKIENNQYLDLIINDGENKKIKKSDIDYLISRFSKTPVESQKKNIYIINLVENMTIQAVNSLLKFLEEPLNNTYAFLTTKNEKKVISTIISRSQKLTLSPIARTKIINICKKNNILLEDAELLSYFYSNPITIKEISKNNDFIIIKKCLDDYLKNIKKEIFFLLESSILSKIISKDKQTTNKNCNLFLNLLFVVFEDIIRNQNNKNIILSTYSNIIKDLSSINNIEMFMFEIIKLKEQINNFNINIASALEHLTFFITNNINK